MDGCVCVLLLPRMSCRLCELRWFQFLYQVSHCIPYPHLNLSQQAETTRTSNIFSLSFSGTTKLCQHLRFKELSCLRWVLRESMPRWQPHRTELSVGESCCRPEAGCRCWVSSSPAARSLRGRICWDDQKTSVGGKRPFEGQ